MEKEQLEELYEKIVELFEEGDYQSIRAAISDLEPFDLSVICEELEEKQLPLFFRMMAKDVAAECFSNMSSELQELLIRRMSDSELKAMLDELFVDDTVDIIEEMPANVAARMLANSDPQTRAQINQILNYPKDSAGSLMTTEYVRLDKNMSVIDAFTRIRRVGTEKETSAV